VKINRAGIELLKRWEGCRLKAYQDSVGVWTIGYGLTSAAGLVKVTPGMIITQQQADDYLVAALVKYEAAVTKALKRAPNSNQFSAMVSLCYNIGPGAFAKSSIARLFNDGDIDGAADSFLLWNKAGGKVLKGLVDRRKAERSLFLAGASQPAPPPAPRPPPPPPIPPPPDIEPPPVDAPEAPPGNGVAGWIIAAIAAAASVFAAWMMKG
jgi:lysozyme